MRRLMLALRYWRDPRLCFSFRCAWRAAQRHF